MVRTLDFHSNNVGSIPASLIFMQKFIISNRKKIQKQSVFSNQKFNKLRYSLNFKTIIPPTQVAVNSLNLQTSFERNSTISSKKSGKLLIKQSYLLLTWFKFLLMYKGLSKTLNLSNINFFIKPQRRFRFTITKSPMAQKTFSQEQYAYLFYSLVLTVTIIFPNDKVSNLNIKSALYLLNLVKNFTFFTETNLFFLQRLSLTVGILDYGYMRLT
jgi:hypothetical protein